MCKNLNVKKKMQAQEFSQKKIDMPIKKSAS
jgi:hypothetical protein